MGRERWQQNHRCMVGHCDAKSFPALRRIKIFSSHHGLKPRHERLQLSQPPVLRRPCARRRARYARGGGRRTSPIGDSRCELGYPAASLLKQREREKQNGTNRRTGEIAIFANFTKSTGSFPPFLICLFNLLRMVRLLQLELLRETLPTVETDDSIMFSDLKKECPSSSLVL